MHLRSSYVIPTVASNDTLQVVTLHASPKFIAVALDDGDIHILNAQGEHERTLPGHAMAVWALTSWEDSSILISGGVDRRLRIWDTATGECLHTLPGHTSTIRGLAMPSADTVVSCSKDTTLRAWNIESGSCLRVLEGHTDTVRYVVVQGDHIVSGGYDKLVKSWSLSSGQCLFTSDANEERMYCMAGLNEGAMVACGSLNGRTFPGVTDLAARSSMGELNMGPNQRGLVNAIKEGEDNTLLTGNTQGTIHVYDIQGPHHELERSFVAHTPGSISSLIVFDSRNILTSGAGGKVRLWDLDVNDEGHETPVAEIEGRADVVWRVVNVGHTVIIALSRGDKTVIEVWDLELTSYPPRELKTRKEHPG